MQRTFARGEKARLVREALDTLGPDTTYPEAARWLKRWRDMTVSEGYFHHVLKALHAIKALPVSNGQAQPAPLSTMPPPRDITLESLLKAREALRAFGGSAGQLHACLDALEQLTGA